MIAAATNSLHAAQLASPFTDHMVLQHGASLPVWGTCAPGESVAVSFNGSTKSTTADDKGNWMVKLDAVPANKTPAELDVKAKSGNVTISDVLVGDVWIASGQSNMAFALSNAKAKDKDSKSASPPIRMFKTEWNTSAEPATEFKGSWQLSGTQGTNPSAVAFFFAKHLQEHAGIPIGIINSSVGGTPARAWTPRFAMEEDPRLQNQIDYIDGAVTKFDPAAAEAKYQAEMKKYQEDLAKYDSLPADAKKRKPKVPKKSVSPALWQHSPSALYNGMIAPIVPMAVRGVIWYQGEADSKAAAQYRVLFPALIKSWRKAFGHEMPFLFVQIAPHNAMSPEIRDAQLFTWRTVPNTGMAVITDLGHPSNIHPNDKEPVGERLALFARAMVHGEDIVHSGPLFDELRVSGNRAFIAFKHVGDGLLAKGGDLTGFEISADGKEFLPAKAVIEGDKVIVTSDKVAKPVAVRFGWANVPDNNFFNKNGLPATPFRSGKSKD